MSGEEAKQVSRREFLKGAGAGAFLVHTCAGAINDDSIGATIAMLRNKDGMS
jgi:hypothetical protein